MTFCQSAVEVLAFCQIVDHHCLLILTAHAVLVLTAHAVHLEVVLVELVDHPWACHLWEHMGHRVPDDHCLLISTAHSVLVYRLVYEEAHLEVVLVDHPWVCRPWEHLGHRIPA